MLFGCDGDGCRDGVRCSIIMTALWRRLARNQGGYEPGYGPERAPVF
jgi:hypothetical protein